MKAIDRAKLHFSTLQVKTIQVPQWIDENDRPLTIYMQPLTVKDREALTKTEKITGPGLELIVHGIIRHARDEKGDLLFTLEDKPDLMNRADPGVILSIGAHMFDELDPEEIKKN